MNAATTHLPPATQTTQKPAATERAASRHRNAGRLIGALFLAGFATYFTGNALMSAAIGSTDVIAGAAAHRTTLALGVVLMLGVVAVDIGKAVLFVPVLGPRGRRTALVYLSGMIVETTLMAVGAIGLLSLVPLADQVQSGATTAAVAQSVGSLAVDVNTLAYQTSQAVLAVGAFFLCTFLYRTPLIPRLLALWGAVGYVLHFAGAVAELFDLHISLVLLIPGGLFELTFGVWLLLRGFTPTSTSQPSEGRS